MIPSATDDWWKDAVVYQIYPRSFFDSNGDGVGDLKGVIEKLGYVGDLGVDAIWLSPFFRSPMKDFGYDVSDYRDVDPLFGSLADFDALLTRAHGLGLKVIIDQVWSHTSDQHPWFLESAASRDNPKADWYVWADAKADGSPPNNWLAVFGGPSWTWSPKRRQYYLHNFLAEQPDLNFWNPAVQDAVLDTARFWLDRGVDGLRLDVINLIVHDRLLRDNPPTARADGVPAAPVLFQRHLYDRSRPEALDFVARLRALLDGYGGRMAVGEIFDEEPLKQQLAYTDGSDRLHTAYSFFLLDATAATPTLFAEALQAWAGARGWPSWSLGNHDVVRFPTRLAGPADQRRIKGLLAALLCLRGTPFLYQGDELGLPHGRVPFDRLRDPFAIAAYDGGSGRDGARTPMPWLADAPNGGFSSAAETWLPADPAHTVLAVARQEDDSDSVLNFTREFLKRRRTSPALRRGDVTVLPAPPGVLAVERAFEGERMLCVFELAGAAAVFNHPELAGAEPLGAYNGADRGNGGLLLPPFAFAVMRLRARAQA